MGLLDTPIFPTQQMISAGVTPPTMTVWDDGTYLYIRSLYGTVGGTSYDLVIECYRSHPLSYNRNFNFNRTHLVRSSDRIGDISSGNITFDSSMTDDVGPINFSGRGNSAGNHAFEGSLVTKAAHGITAADVGQRWVDNVGRNWRLLSVPSTSTLYFAAQPDANGYTRAAVSTTGTLTYLDGASNVSTPFTASIGVQSGEQMTDPAGRWVRDRSLSILCDGVELQTNEFKYNVRELIVRDRYNIPRHDNVYSEMTSTSPVLSTVTAGFSVTREFRFYGWGQASCQDFCRNLGGNWSVNVISTLQANPITMVSPYTARWRWIPGAAASGPGSLNLSAPANHTTGPSGDPVWRHPTHSADSNFAPDGHIEFATSSGASLTAETALIGRWVFMDPLGPESGITARASNMVSAAAGFGALRITTSTNKVYPNGWVTPSGFMNANDSIRLGWHRRWFQPQTSGPIAVVYVQETDGRMTVRCAWQAAHGEVQISLPQWLNGRVATLTYASGGSLLSSRVSNGALTVNCSSAPGFAIITLYPRNP